MNISDENRLDAAVEQLPRSLQPPHDLWPGIAAGISRRQIERASHGVWRFAGVAAAILMVTVSITWTISGYRSSPDNPDFASVVPETHASADNNSRTAFTAQLASDHGMPPKARQALLANLRLLDESIKRTQAAVKKYPNDVNLQALLFNLYQQEARIMSDAQQAQIQTTVRNTL